MGRLLDFGLRRDVDDSGMLRHQARARRGTGAAAFAVALGLALLISGASAASVALASGTTHSTSLGLADGAAWEDANSAAWGPWGTYSIYVDGNLIGTKPADGTSWSCPKTVNVQYRDDAGNVTTLTDTIVLAVADTTPPTTTSSFNPSAGAVFNAGQPVILSAMDNVGGTGVKATYYRVDAGSYVAGTSFSATGDGLHTFSYYSVDNSNNTETVHVSNSFRIDTVAPVTTCSALSGHAYTGAQSFTLTPTDSGSGVAGTFWQLDTIAGAWTSGTVVPVAAPASGSVSHTVYFYSRDLANNSEATKSVTFSVAPAAGGTTHTTSLVLGDGAWVDANSAAWGPSGTYSIYANGVLIGTKPAGSPTWSCPQTAVPSGARLDIVESVGFASELFEYASSGPVTFSLTLPAGTARLEAATWSGFPGVSRVNEYSEDYDEVYTGIWLPPGTITGITYMAGGG
jgi:hypothetical protein